MQPTTKQWDKIKAKAKKRESEQAVLDIQSQEQEYTKELNKSENETY